MSRARRVDARAERGVSMIEVLVTLVIVAFGLLGLAALQARSLSVQVDSESRRVATTLVTQLYERVTANQEGYGLALATRYTRTMNPGQAVTIPTCANPDACDAQNEVPEVQLALWLTEVSRQLPGAAVWMGATTPGSVMSMTVSVGWLEPNANAVAADAACNLIDAVSADVRYRCMTVTFFPG
jgi:type IV pilus modification protein PilV